MKRHQLSNQGGFGAAFSRATVHPAPPARGRKGFSVIELLVVIAIIILLMALLLPAVRAARASARRHLCVDNLHRIGIGLRSHEDARGHLPDGGGPALLARRGGRRIPRHVSVRNNGNRPEIGWGWGYQILPYTDQENRYNNPNDEAVIGSTIGFYRCPARDRPETQNGALGDTIGLSDYVGNGCSNCDLTQRSSDRFLNPAFQDHQDGVFVQSMLGDGANHDYQGKPLMISALHRVGSPEIRDGLSYTVCVAEKQVLASPTPCNDSLGWVSGFAVRNEGSISGMDMLFSGIEGAPAADIRDDNVHCTSRAGGPHRGGGNVLFCDGNVRFVRFGMDDDVWRAILTIDGREDVDLDRFEFIGDEH